MSNTYTITEGNKETDITFIITGDTAEILYGTGKSQIINNQVYPGVRNKCSVENARMIFRNYLLIGFKLA